MGYQWVISGLSEGYQSVISGLSESYQWIIRGLSEGYQWVIRGLSEGYQFLIVSHCFSVFLTNFNHFSPFFIVSHLFSLFLTVSHCVSLFSRPKSSSSFGRTFIYHIFHFYFYSLNTLSSREIFNKGR